MTADDIRTKALEALLLLGNVQDNFVREEYMLSLLTYTYQAGRIDANDEAIKRNEAALSNRARAA
jgi:hypothetical protein